VSQSRSTLEVEVHACCIHYTVTSHAHVVSSLRKLKWSARLQNPKTPMFIYEQHLPRNHTQHAEDICNDYVSSSPVSTYSCVWLTETFQFRQKHVRGRHMTASIVQRSTQIPSPTHLQLRQLLTQRAILVNLMNIIRAENDGDDESLQGKKLILACMPYGQQSAPCSSQFIYSLATGDVMESP